jgi:hypothetical protein
METLRLQGSLRGSMLNATRMLSLRLARLPGVKVIHLVASLKSPLRMARESLEQNIHARTPYAKRSEILVA